MTRRPDAPDSPEVLARVEEAVALVRSIARQLRRLLGGALTIDELASFGHEGALTAARKFDATRGVPYTRWATLKVRGAILDGLRTHGAIPRRHYRRLKSLAAMNEINLGAAEQDSAPPPSSPEAADERIGMRLGALGASLALSEIFTSDEETVEGIPDERGTPEDEMLRDELREALRAAIAERPEVERRLIEGFYVHERPLDELAGEMSRAWASRTLANALAGLEKSIRRALRPLRAAWRGACYPSRRWRAESEWWSR
jgi:RNA polymerase sigma factor for flagellar operon FliA